MLGEIVGDGLVDTLLGQSAAMADLRAYLPKVARSEATVLISGETGTGKERVAEILHNLSPRRRLRFVPVNCAALPEGLIESELFGHIRGAFTGAVANSTGAVGEADGGTLFLDEIGEMSLSGQAKLLRVLESREVSRVGTSKTEEVDIRVVAATNQDLEKLVEQKRFRADLFYRLNVAWIELAPLRDRPDDIADLFHNYIERFNRQTGRNVGPPDDVLLDCLARHAWPGNVRELRNLVEAVFIDPPRGTLRLEHLPPRVRQRFEQYHRTVPDEQQRLINALRRTNWNKTQAARRLNWSRMTLYRKMAKYHIDDSGSE